MGTLRTAVFATLLFSGGANAHGDVCEALAGPVRQRASNMLKRGHAMRGVAVDPSGRRIIYTTAPLSAPKPLRPAGMTLARASMGSFVVRVDDALKARCSAREITLGVDDSLGRGFQIVHVDPAGVLLMKSDELFWWGLETPRFQMVWRSRFAMEVGTSPGIPIQFGFR